MFIRGVGRPVIKPAALRAITLDLQRGSAGASAPQGDIMYGLAIKFPEIIVNH